MPERIPRLGSTAPAGRRINRLPKPNRNRNPGPSCRSRRATNVITPKTSDEFLLRSASDPVSWLLPVSPDSQLPLQTFADAFSSAALLQMLPPTNPFAAAEDAKVVVSVTVEGSPGPVRVLARLGATVDEVIGVVVDMYGEEGRSPKLDHKQTSSFQLHHSQFSLQSLDKSYKIGDVGGRCFYLRKSASNNDYFNFGSGGRRNASGESENEFLNSSSSRYNSVTPKQPFFSFIHTRLCKFRRRMRKLWRVLISTSNT